MINAVSWNTGLIFVGLAAIVIGFLYIFSEKAK